MSADNPLHTFSQYGGFWTVQGFGYWLFGYWFDDSFHALGTVQVYSKNWNSQVKTALSLAVVAASALC